jgi:futalosine hydrolase
LSKFAKPPVSPILYLAATDRELAAVPDALCSSPNRAALSGVGIPVVFEGAERWLSPSVGLIVNIGIAGAYPGAGIAIGDIVIADCETYGDIGFELPDEIAFRPISASEFGAFYRDPFPTVTPAEWRGGPDLGFRVHTGRGCTVNACTGTQATGVRRRDLFGAVFETMEGAAIAQIGRRAGIPVCEIRVISNIAGDRDMRPENIARALANLRRYLETRKAPARVP